MYLICKNGAAIMPVRTDGVTQGDGLVEVTSPQGTVYTVRPENLIGQEEGDHLLRLQRGQQLIAEGYDAKRRGEGVYRVYSEARHGELGGYIVTETSCTCPDAAKGHVCKHQLGLCALLHAIAANKAAQRAAVPVTVTLAAATRVSPSARLAAMIAHDGWE